MSEVIEVRCTCGKKLKAKPKLAGKKVKCPNCSQPLRIPAAQTSATQPETKRPKLDLGFGTPEPAPEPTPAAPTEKPKLDLGFSTQPVATPAPQPAPATQPVPTPEPQPAPAPQPQGSVPQEPAPLQLAPKPTPSPHPTGTSSGTPLDLSGSLDASSAAPTKDELAPTSQDDELGLAPDADDDQPVRLAPKSKQQQQPAYDDEDDDGTELTLAPSEEAPALQQQGSSPLVAPSQVDAPIWFVQNTQGQQFGPMTRAQMDTGVANGNVTADCQVWQTGQPPIPATQVYPNLAGGAPAGAQPQPAPTLQPTVPTVPQPAATPQLAPPPGAQPLTPQPMTPQPLVPVQPPNAAPGQIQPLAPQPLNPGQPMAQQPGQPMAPQPLHPGQPMAQQPLDPGLGAPLQPVGGLAAPAQPLGAPGMQPLAGQPAAPMGAAPMGAAPMGAPAMGAPATPKPIKKKKKKKKASGTGDSNANGFFIGGGIALLLTIVGYFSVAGLRPGETVRVHKLVALLYQIGGAPLVLGGGLLITAGLFGIGAYMKMNE